MALGLVAPFSGALSDRLGARLLSVAGMAVCVAAVLILGIAEAHSDIDHTLGTIALALFGAGLGVFIAPNNHATLKAAPASHAGEASSMLNLMRVLGSSIGVAAASSTLSWRPRAASGTDASWVYFAGHPILAAVESSLVMVVIMAIAAGLVSLASRDNRPPLQAG